MKLGVSRYCENLAAGLACIATDDNEPVHFSSSRRRRRRFSASENDYGVKRSLRMIDALFLSACAASAH